MVSEYNTLLQNSIQLAQHIIVTRLWGLHSLGPFVPLWPSLRDQKTTHYYRDQKVAMTSVSRITRQLFQNQNLVVCKGCVIRLRVLLNDLQVLTTSLVWVIPSQMQPQWAFITVLKDPLTLTWVIGSLRTDFKTRFLKSTYLSHCLFVCLPCVC